MTEFWDRVNQSGGLDACWPWTGYRRPDGYGVYLIRDRWRGRRAHRIAFELAHGHQPEVVMHACDNPPCCNPLHLVGGTQTDNLADMTRKGRRAPMRRFKGEAHPRAKLTWAIVHQARARRYTGEPINALAREFGVAPQVMRNALIGRTWKEPG